MIRRNRKGTEINGALLLLLFWFMLRGAWETLIDVLHLFIV